VFDFVAIARQHVALSEDMELVNAQFIASCQVPEARCALDVCKIELAIDDQTGMSQVSQQECSSAETWLAEGNTRVVAVRAELSNLDPGLYDFHVRIWCAGVLQAQITSSVVVMHPDVLPDECVPTLVIPDEPQTIMIPKDQRTCITTNAYTELVLQGCEGIDNRFRARFFLRNVTLFSFLPFDYMDPVAILEDARHATNILLPCRGYDKLYVELVSRDGMERVVAAAILSILIKNE